jgi:excisionase family DNA binding protein
MTTLVDRLRRMAEAVPPGGAVVVPRDWLETELRALVPTLEDGADLTVDQVAEQLRRPVSTIRGWLEGGRFAGAYKCGRVWRVPRRALDARRVTPVAEREISRLAAWRSVRRSGA